MVDLSFLEKMTKGDTKRMKRYISIYLSAAPVTFKRMEQNVIEQDWEQLRINAHSLKPQAEYMGILSLKTILIEIEQSVYNKQFASLHKLYEKAFMLHNKSTPYLRAVIESA